MVSSCPASLCWSICLPSNRGKTTVGRVVSASGFGAAAGCASAGPRRRACSSNCDLKVTIPADARLTAAHFRNGPQGARYVFDPDVPFGLPFRPTPFTATFTMSVDDTPFTITRPIQARSEGDIFSGEKRSEIHVVPAFAVTTTPEIVVVSTSGTESREPGAGKDVRVTVTNHSKGAATADVASICRRAGARRRRPRP